MVGRQVHRKKGVHGGMCLSLEGLGGLLLREGALVDDGGCLLVLSSDGHERGGVDVGLLGGDSRALDAVLDEPSLGGLGLSLALRAKVSEGEDIDAEGVLEEHIADCSEGLNGLRSEVALLVEADSTAVILDHNLALGHVENLILEITIERIIVIVVVRIRAVVVRVVLVVVRVVRAVG